MRIKKSILCLLSAMAIIVLSAACILLLHNMQPNRIAFAEEAGEDEPTEVVSDGGTLTIIGQTEVYRGETVTYTVKYTTEPSATFLQYDLSTAEVALGPTTQGDHCYFCPITVSDEALPGTVFTFTVTNLLNNDSVSIEVSLKVLYATGIEELMFAVNDTPLGNEVPKVHPGDTVSVNIEKFTVGDEIYEAGKLTFTQYSLSLKGDGEKYAELNENYTKIIIKDGAAIDTDNPVIVVEVTVTQNWAPEEYLNLRTTIEMPVYVPLETFEVTGTDGEIARNSSFTYEVKYNSGIYGDSSSENEEDKYIASDKGFKYSLTDASGNPLTDNYFSVDWANSDIGEGYFFTINVAKNAPAGSTFKAVLSSNVDPNKTDTIELSVKELESAYALVYSKDYTGTTNPDNGIQLVENGNKTQLRVGYNADILFRGSTSNTLYTVSALDEYGVVVDFGGELSFETLYIYSDGRMRMDTTVPAYTGGNRTSFDYTVDIGDGTKSYEQFSKTVEAYVPVTGSVVQSLQLQNGGDFVNSAQKYLLELSYDVVANVGSNYTVRPIDLYYTVNNSNFTITKDTVNNKVQLVCNTPDNVGNGSITITVNSNSWSSYAYNGQNMNGTWSISLTVKRGFITTATHLNAIRNDTGTTSRYKLQDTIYLNADDIWTPISSFSGVLDGNNRSIVNLTVGNYNAECSESMFGFIQENYGTIKNLNLSQAYVTLHDLWVDDSGGDYFINYSNLPLYCGFFVAKNYGTISNCDSTGSYFQFACVIAYSEAYAGVICGANYNLIENCEVFESAVQIGMGNAGGIAGYNEYGQIRNCSISLSSIYCYMDFDDSLSALKLLRYSGEHYASAGGVVGHSKGGTISGCTIYSNVTIRYNGYESESRSLAPCLGGIAGKTENNTSIYGNTSNGEVEQGELKEVTWKGGFLWLETKRHNQAQHVGGDVGYNMDA